MTEEAVVQQEVPGVTVVNVAGRPELTDTVEELTELQKSIPVVVAETKKGYKTTEFWVSVIASFAVVFNGIPAPESKEGYIVAALAGLYAVARGLAKRGTPAVAPLGEVVAD